MKVRFLKDSDNGEGTIFRVGEIHELSTPSAMHWINRRRAVQVDDEAETTTSGGDVTTATVGTPETATAPAQTPKRRGRPPKNPEA